MNKLNEYWLMLRSYLALTIVLASAGTSYHLSAVYHYELLLQRTSKGEYVELARACGPRDWKFNDIYKPIREKQIYCQADDVIAPAKRPKRKRKGP